MHFVLMPETSTTTIARAVRAGCCGCNTTYREERNRVTTGTTSPQFRVDCLGGNLDSSMLSYWNAE